MNRASMLLPALVIFALSSVNACYGDSDTSTAAFPYYAVIQGQMRAIDKSGHPIFVTACKQGMNRYILVLTNPLEQGFLAVFHNNDVVDMASITESAVNHNLVVEANGGGVRNAEMDEIVKSMSKLSFHLIRSLSYQELANHPVQGLCHLANKPS